MHGLNMVYRDGIKYYDDDDDVELCFKSAVYHLEVTVSKSSQELYILGPLLITVFYSFVNTD